jgi:hypothetical protein
VGFGDFAREGQAEAGAAALGGVERHQGVGQHRLAHAGAAVLHFDAQHAVLAAQFEADGVGRGAGLMRVLQQVQQGLLHLRRVEGMGFVGHLAQQVELHLVRQGRQEGRPMVAVQAWRGQLGEAGVAEDEAFEVARALFDGGEDLRQALGLAAPHQFGAGVGQGGQGGQGIVQFVADDADHLLPRLHFLAAQFLRQLAQEQQFMGAAIQAEAAARQVEHFLVFAVADGEQAIAAAPDGFAQGGLDARQQLGQAQAFQLAALVHQLAGGQVGEHDGAVVGDQQHGDGGVLHHGVEQQFALHQAQALLAQHVAQRVVGGDQVAQFIVVRPVQAEGKIAVAVAGDGAGQRAVQRELALQLGADGDDGQRHQA